MAAQISLMSYLQVRLPPLQQHYDYASRTHNTQNWAYSYQDINQIGTWLNFDLNTILQQFDPILNGARIDREPARPSSPVRLVNCETAVRARVDQYLSNRVIRAIRCGFAYDHHNLTTVCYDCGNLARIIDLFTPDVAYFNPRERPEQRRNRVPGDIKPSYKWNMRMQNHPLPWKQEEFRQALSQINWYMKQHRTRYSFILTDEVFVAVKRLDSKGNLQLSRPVSWNASGTAEKPVLTVALALWYMAMLAGDDGPGGWDFDKQMPKPDTKPEATKQSAEKPAKNLSKGTGKDSSQGQHARHSSSGHHSHQPPSQRPRNR